MDPIISIRPSKDLLNNYAQISALAKENPVAITVNGREDTVIIGHGNYVNQQRRMSELEELTAIFSSIMRAEADIRKGNIQTADEAFDDIFKEIDRMENDE